MQNKRKTESDTRTYNIMVYDVDVVQDDDADDKRILIFHYFNEKKKKKESVTASRSTILRSGSM